VSISGNIHTDAAEQESWRRSCFEEIFRVSTLEDMMLRTAHLKEAAGLECTKMTPSVLKTTKKAGPFAFEKFARLNPKRQGHTTHGSNECMSYVTRSNKNYPGIDIF